MLPIDLRISFLALDYHRTNTITSAQLAQIVQKKKKKI
jgi:hypothetical protein